MSLEDVPPPALKRRGRLSGLVWLAPAAAAALAFWYVRGFLKTRGASVTVYFSDVTGVRRDTGVFHRGVPIGAVTAMGLSEGGGRAYLELRLDREASGFARQGAVYWMVRPTLSESGIGGLNALASGPYIEALPGAGAPAREFDGLAQAPEPRDGPSFVLVCPRLHELRPGAPVTFRGVEVGQVEETELSPQSDEVDVRVAVGRRYRALVRDNSRFWYSPGVDVKGGLLSGVEVKLSGIMSLLGGSIAFATPDKGMGPEAKDGRRFALEEGPSREWLLWKPKIAVVPAPAETREAPALPNGRDLMRRNTGE